MSQWESNDTAAHLLTRTARTAVGGADDDSVVCAAVERLRELEGGTAGVFAATGPAILASVVLACVGGRGHVLYQEDLDERTRAWFEHGAPRLGILAEAVDAADLAKIADGLARGARLLFVETISATTLREIDLAAVAWHCRSFGARLCVDNSRLTAALRRPLAAGTDLVIYSDTRLLTGCADAPAGFVAGCDTALVEAIRGTVASLGGTLDSRGPHGAVLVRDLVQGIATLAIRREHAQRTARCLVERLQGRASAARAVYPGWGTHLAFEYPSDDAAAAAYQRVSPRLRMPDASGVRSQIAGAPPSGAHHGPASRRRLTLLVGLEPVDELWPLVSAVASDSEAEPLAQRRAPTA